MRKKVVAQPAPPDMHWVGDGFPVRTLISYGEQGAAISPFLLLDFAGPMDFPPALEPRGVGTHPHRGFETVTLVYEGEVSHRDSTGKGGTIGPGDVQWMTAASGILHQEFHSPTFTKTGGRFRVIQLWVNLPAKDKMSPPGYQAIAKADIPVVPLEGGAGALRVIAGEHVGTRGPARTFTPINVWDMTLRPDAEIVLEVPEGHNGAVVVLSGHASVAGAAAGAAGVVLLGRQGTAVPIRANGETALLVLSGTPIDEPIAGYGPFVMNSQAEIRQAIADFNSGRFGAIEPT